MKYKQERLYLSTFINSFGTWLTFLAIALLVQQKYGGQQVAWIFLAQTLPAILFSRGLANLIPADKQERYYWISQVALAANCLVLCFDQSLPVLYVHLFISAFLKSISGPVFNTLVGRWVETDKIKETFIRIGSIQTSTLALAPIAGAWIKIVSSVEILFFIDAMSFLISILLLKDFLSQRSTAVKAVSQAKATFKEVFAGIAYLPKDIPKPLWTSLLLWFSFLGLGALLNALEFAGFERLKMDEAMIGYALAAWGVGSLFAFLKKSDLSVGVICSVFLVSLVFFLITPSAWSAVAVFVIAGWASALFSGILRSNIQIAVPEGYNALPIWAFANQITQLINLIAYASVGLLLSALGFHIFAALMIVLGLGIQIAVSSPKGFFAWFNKQARAL